MSVCYTFPGQGSQKVGMGQDLANQFAEAKAVFDEVDAALGEKLSQLIFDGPSETLTLTQNAQPALMAVSVAVERVLAARGHGVADKAAYVAGHSLGEYSALAAAGAFSLTDAAKLLRLRGEAMQQAVPVGEGAMAAIIGLEFDQVQAIAVEVAQGEVCQPANDNAPGQIVVSGSSAAIERAMALAKDAGAQRAIPLPVSAPFHCAMMAPAAEAMAEALAATTIQAPVVPVISNVLAAPISDPDEIRTRLVEQVTGTVRWRESVQAMSGLGIDTLYEVGAGKVLCGLARRINRELSCRAIGTVEDIEAVLG